MSKYDNGSFNYDLGDFQEISIILGDRIPRLWDDGELKFTAYWKGLDDDYLFNLMTILHLAKFCKVQVTPIRDEDENLKGISFEIRDYPTNKTVVIQEDDCGYIEVVDDKGEYWRDLSDIVLTLTYEVHYHIEEKLKESREKWEKEQKEAAMAN